MILRDQLGAPGDLVSLEENIIDTTDREFLVPRPTEPPLE